MLLYDPSSSLWALAPVPAALILAKLTGAQVARRTLAARQADTALTQLAGGVDRGDPTAGPPSRSCRVPGWITGACLKQQGPRVEPPLVLGKEPLPTGGGG